MILGYTLSGQYNDSYLKADLYEKNISDCIDYVNNRQNYITENFKVKKTKYDFSYSYDGALIVSQRFKDFCIKNNLKKTSFGYVQHDRKVFQSPLRFKPQLVIKTE